jgi:DNA-binding Xre family transcriptional regulator
MSSDKPPPRRRTKAPVDEAPAAPELIAQLLAERDRLIVERDQARNAQVLAEQWARLAAGDFRAPPELLRQGTLAHGELAKIVSANLPVFRAAAQGMSQRELADRASISKNHMSLIESGQANITLETLEKLAHALGRSPLELLVRKVV